MLKQILRLILRVFNINLMLTHEQNKIIMSWNIAINKKGRIKYPALFCRVLPPISCLNIFLFRKEQFVFHCKKQLQKHRQILFCSKLLWL